MKLQKYFGKFYFISECSDVNCNIAQDIIEIATTISNLDLKIK